jgi:hypothetical protein
MNLPLAHFALLPLVMLIALPTEAGEISQQGAKPTTIQCEGWFELEGGDRRQQAKLSLKQKDDLLEGQWESEAAGFLKGWRRNGLCSLRGRLSSGSYLVLLGECNNEKFVGNLTMTGTAVNQEGLFELRIVSGQLKPIIKRQSR